MRLQDIKTDAEFIGKQLGERYDTPVNLSIDINPEDLSEVIVTYKLKTYSKQVVDVKPVEQTEVVNETNG
jgi:hypothetical protein